MHLVWLAATLGLQAKETCYISGAPGSAVVEEAAGNQRVLDGTIE